MPWRYSPVVPTTPSTISSPVAMPAPASASRRSVRVSKSTVAKVTPSTASVSSTMAIRKPSAVRVVRSFSSSELTSAVMTEPTPHR